MTRGLLTGSVVCHDTTTSEEASRPNCRCRPPTGWAPLRLLAIYNPGGAERALKDLPDYRLTPAGEIARLRREG